MLGACCDCDADFHPCRNETCFLPTESFRIFSWLSEHVSHYHDVLTVLFKVCLALQQTWTMRARE